MSHWNLTGAHKGAVAITIEQAASLLANINNSIMQADGSKKELTVEDMIKTWREHRGEKLDAYILPGTYSVVIRYGQEFCQYLTICSNKDAAKALFDAGDCNV